VKHARSDGDGNARRGRITRRVLAACAALGGAAVALAAQAQESVPATGVRESFRLLDLPELWVVVLLVLPATALLAWLGYVREPLTLRARGTLAVLRFLAFCLLLGVVFRPVFVKRREEVKPAEVLVLVDDSASMQRKDTYGGDDDVRERLAALGGRAPAELSRSELARAAVEKELLPKLASGGYVVRLQRFAENLEPLTSPAALSARGHATHVGDALQQALAASRGHHVTDVVIVSDGRSNGGLAPSEAARNAAASGIPVHTVVVGDTRPERNVVVEIAEAPTTVLEGDEVEVSVRVLARGVSGVTTSRVVLEELSAGGNTRPVAEDEVELSETGTKSVLLAPPGLPEARTTERRFRVSVPPLEGETLRDDNAVEFSVHVTPEKIRVLFVDAYPRWEYRYLKNLLLRADANLEVQCFLLSATPDFRQESTKGIDALTAVPTARKDLLEHYDVVILGDVNPYAISPDPSRCEEFMASLREFVERGGGLILGAGEYDNPRAYAGTPLEELLPVVLDSAGASTSPADATVEFRPRLEDPAHPHEVVRLVQDVAQNRSLWEDAGGLRGFYWYARIVRAKPGAQVLLRHPTDVNAHGALPLLVGGYYPSGRTLFLAVDATWMWRYRYGDRYHERFWRNAIRWVALGRLKSGDRRMQLDAQRARYNLDERITLEARVLDEDFRPSDAPKLPVRLSDVEGKTTDVQLDLVPERPGLYRASYEAERTGVYSAWIEVNGQRAATAEYEVVLPSRENADPSPDPATLAAVSAATRGRAVDLAHTRDLDAEFPGKEERREPISSELEDAWDNWGTLCAALVLLSLEWILRKRWELV
jgi:uncharacterized membrane protein